MTETGKRSESMAPWAVLLAFLLITALATRYVWDSSRLADRSHFVTTAQSTRDAIQFRLETYSNVLRAAAGLFAADHAVTRDEFRDYVRKLEVQQRYPGIQGVGLTIRIRPHDMDSVVEDLRANEFPDFHVWPEALRDEYHAIVVLEPLDRRNRAAIGYDMYTEPVRREAMSAARDSGLPVASGRVRLVQEIDPVKQPGFLLYVPVYNTKVIPPTIPERRDALYGFVYSPFRAWDLFHGILGAGKPEIRFAVFDGGDLIYVSDPGGDKTKNPRYTSTARFKLASREWRIEFESARSGVGAPLVSSIATGFSGVAIAFLLFALLRVQLRARAEAERTAERLRESEAGLQAASRAKDEFLATLSHELRTPMTAIMGWSNLLADKLDPETYRTAVESIQRSSKAQAQLIDDLLDVSRITAGKMRIDPKPVDLGPIVASAAAAVSPTAETRGVTLKVVTSPAPMLVHGDASRLQQVVWNLLTNAVKFTPAGGNIEVAMRSEHGHAFVSVTDSGRGIEPDFLPHVFERFRQADSSTTRSYTGLGLGLAIVRHLVELHGGRVTAESRGLGHGSRFTVRLPLIEVGRSSSVVEPPYDPDVAATLRGARIVLVDDEEGIRNYGGAVFRMSGANVRCVKSGPDALEALKRSPADVVVTDIGMPEMDGFELLRRIRDSADERIAELPVVALTAYARPEDRERSERAGFEAFVAKPVDPAELRGEVARVLRAVRASRLQAPTDQVPLA